MYYIFNLDNQKEHWCMAELPRKQALKTVFALQNGLGSALATSFEALMVKLEKDIVETANVYTLGSYTVLKK